MSRILLAWELGGNYGHISVLLPLARHLRERGHEVLFAVKDTGTASQLLESEEFSFIQAPQAHARGRGRHEPLSFADILAESGFGDAKELEGLTLAWHNLFHLFRPDTLVAEYAPVSQFAARLSGLPRLQLNTGFGSPPDMTPYPCFRPWLKPTQNKLLQREAEILHTINTVCGRQGFPEFPNLQQAMKGDLDLLATLPELDHYQGRRNGRFIGPISIVSDGIDMQWSEENTPRIFAYLRPGPGIKTILKTLQRSDANVIACIPGIDDELIALFTNERLHICTARVRLSSILRDMDLAITHANHGTLAALLLAGVPTLMIPTTIEQWMLSRALERLGIGIGVRRDKMADVFPVALEKLLSDHSYRKKAKGLAKKYAVFDERRVIERLINTIERLPGWAT